MKTLSELKLDQLALALTGEPRLPMNEVLEECQRRQRMLDAAEGMAAHIENTVSPCDRPLCLIDYLAAKETP